MSNDSNSKKPGGHSPGFLDTSVHTKAHEEEGEGNWLISYADMMTLLVGFFVILLSFSSMDPEKFEAARKSITAEFGGNYQIPYADLANHLAEIVKKLGVGDQLIIKQSDVGIEIYSRGTVFFETGSADLKPEAREIIGSFLNSARKELEGFDVTIEGHTDDAPVVNGKVFRNNWELSSLRACRVLDAFQASGLPSDRLTAVGYGEARPMMPNRDTQGEPISENRAQNRRVVIRLTEHAKPALVDTSQPVASPTPAAPAVEGAAPAAAPAAAASAPAGDPAPRPEAASIPTAPPKAP